VLPVRSGNNSDAVETPATGRLLFISGTPGLVRPEFLIEIEAYASAPAR
jgi:hypothetical protein